VWSHHKIGKEKKEKKEKVGATSYYLLGNLLEFIFKTVNLTFFFSNFLKILAILFFFLV
jgi:hypothetical protein